jgi:V8-like Glu-specific endopeptidase
MKRTCLVLLSLSLVALGSSPARAVVYGADDRVDRHAADPDLQSLADSTAAMFASDHLDVSDPYNIQPIGPAMGDYYGLCPDQRFYDQPSAAWCSGTLIAPDLIVTAGHCMDGPSSCNDTVFVFNYEMMSAIDLAPITIDDLYYCDSILARETNWTEDWAIVQLDRPVAGIDPVPVVRGGLFEHVPTAGELVDIGHPYGIPVKISGNGSVKASHADYFETNCDHFGGNSGSSVSSRPSGDLVGILVRGETDYDYDSDGDCWVVNDCSADVGCVPPVGTGFEHAMRSTLFAHWVPPRCGDWLCDPGEDEFLCPEDCPQDGDHDAVPDVDDNCPLLPNGLQENFDSDGLGDACDCDPADPGIWSRPGEVANLSMLHNQFTGLTLISWDPPPEPGALVVAYDTLRSELPFDFIAAGICVESDDPFDLVAEDGDWLPEGMIYHYLVRAQNSCPDGEGPLGTDFSRRPREGRPCP